MSNMAPAYPVSAMLALWLTQSSRCMSTSNQLLKYGAVMNPDKGGKRRFPARNPISQVDCCASSQSSAHEICALSVARTADINSRAHKDGYTGFGRRRLCIFYACRPVC